MIDWRVPRLRCSLIALASLGSALSLLACSGKVEMPADCRSGASCGGAGAGGSGEGGSAALSSGGQGAQAGSADDICANGRRDADESDIDCGGPSSCARCPTDSRCSASDDCETQRCERNRCLEVEATCSDRIKNQNETDVDCAGVCPPCEVGARCSVDSDCVDEVCSAKKLCVAPTCSDKLKDQDETDVDCGGVCRDTKRCAVGAGCATAADCQSWICSITGRCVADIVVPPADMIDDFEDADTWILSSGGRAGNWYPFSDGSGVLTIDVAAIDRGAGSLTGLHTRGKNFTSWGAGFGVVLNNPGGDSNTKLLYDTSAYSGFTFWARAESAIAMSVAVPNIDTDAAGKVCSACYHHYSRTLQLSTTWQRYKILFSDLVVEKGGVPVPTAFNPRVFSLEFRFNAGTNYDVYVD